jgi:very-short-patch-repair endonuclease
MSQTHQTAPKYIIQLARKFRKEPTPPEVFLWECLRERRFNGFKFRRQHPVGRYIADFFCHEASLVIELDGKIHTEKERKIYDRIRDEELALRGLSVLRITNSELFKEPEKLLNKIASHLPTPLSFRERGRG